MIYQVGFGIIGTVQVQADSPEAAKAKVADMTIQELTDCQSWFDSPEPEEEVLQVDG